MALWHETLWNKWEVPICTVGTICLLQKLSVLLPDAHDKLPGTRVLMGLCSIIYRNVLLTLLLRWEPLPPTGGLVEMNCPVAQHAWQVSLWGLGNDRQCCCSELLVMSGCRILASVESLSRCCQSTALTCTTRCPWWSSETNILVWSGYIAYLACPTPGFASSHAELWSDSLLQEYQWRARIHTRFPKQQHTAMETLVK